MNNPSKYLIRVGKFWFITATIGQYAFGMYVILYYATTAATNQFEVWNKNLFSGIIPGDWLGNISLVFHILLASIVLFGGPLQFMPFIRNRFPRFHRYLGRTYLVLAVLVSLTGVGPVPGMFLILVALLLTPKKPWHFSLMFCRSN